MQRLTYIANVRLPTEKAHGIQIIKMCEAFADQKMRVTLLVPRRRQINKSLVQTDPYEYYQVKNNFDIKRVFCIDLLPLHQIGISLGSFAYLLQEISFSLWASVTANNSGLVYTRSKLVALVSIALGNGVVYEAHDPAKKVWLDKLLANKVPVVAITKSIKNSWEKLGGETFYAPDGVSQEFFSGVSRKKARKILGLRADQKIVLYTGNLYSWKGVDTLAQAAGEVPEYDFYFVGGSVIDKNIKPFRDKYGRSENLYVLGHQVYQKIPLWLKAADVLVIPNSAHNSKGRQDSSPLKLFEYLASGTPVVASKVPSISEIVTKKEVTFFEPDDKESLVQSIKNACNLPQNSKATAVAKEYTWQKRAKHISTYLNN
jgi:glycosyltransferase involved in cell wall biosynthesis